MSNNGIVDEDAFLAGLRKQYPHIHPYGEDDWDWTWADEGHDFLEAQDYLQAEQKFQELIASQPRHPEGYEGLALVYREIERFDAAAILIEEAVRLAAELADKDHMDKDALAEIIKERDEILARQRKHNSPA